MPNGTKGRLDRRDFMILALGSVVATVAASVNADAAMARDAAVSSAAPGTEAQQGTVYTGDVIQGKKVISALDLNDLEPGKHLFYFQGVQMPAGQHWYVSVIVVKGTKAGKRIALISGVLIDRCGPARVAFWAAAVGVAAVSLFISPSGMLGTILDVPINTPRSGGPAPLRGLTQGVSRSRGPMSVSVRVRSDSRTQFLVSAAALSAQGL